MVRHKNRIDRQQTPESIHSFKVCTVSCIDKVTDRHCCYTLTSTSNLLITAIAIASNTVEYSSVPYRISQPAIQPTNHPSIHPSPWSSSRTSSRTKTKSSSSSTSTRTSPRMTHKTSLQMQMQTQTQTQMQMQTKTKTRKKSAL